MPTVFRTHCGHAPWRCSCGGWAQRYLCQECIDVDCFYFADAYSNEGSTRGEQITIAAVRWNERMTELEDMGELDERDLPETGGDR